MKVPARGYCIASTGNRYDACFRTKGQARAAARRLAEKLRTSIDIVNVTNHGEDRHIVGQIEPKGWR